MSRLTKKRKEDIGLSPYALVFRGQKKADKTTMQLIDCNLEFVHEKELKSLDKIDTYITDDTITWINVNGLDDVSLMKKIAETFSIDHNIMSDIMNPSVRPKVQEFDNGLFITLKMLQTNGRRKELTVESLSLIITDNVLISFQEEEGDVFEPIRERIRKQKNINKIRNSGTDYLAFALLDVVVDNYIYYIDLLGEKIENLEENMGSDLNKDLPNQINNYKQELNFMRRHIKPAKEMVLALSKMESEFIQDKNKVNYKELQDNINEASELSDSYREMLYDLLNIYHTSVTARLNDIMKVLTIISVLFIPLTFIVGVYGTNFENFPEIKWKYGYFIMWSIMIIVTGFMLWYFRRKKWF